MQRFNASTLQCEKFEEMPCNLDGMPECSKTGKFLNIFEQGRWKILFSEVWHH